MKPNTLYVNVSNTLNRGSQSFLDFGDVILYSDFKYIISLNSENYKKYFSDRGWSFSRNSDLVDFINKF